MCLEKPAGDQFVGAFKTIIKSFLRKATGTNSEQKMSVFSSICNYFTSRSIDTNQAIHFCKQFEQWARKILLTSQNRSGWLCFSGVTQKANPKWNFLHPQKLSF